MNRLSAIFRGFFWSAMLCWSGAAYGQAETAAGSSATSLLPAEQPESSGAEDEAQCFQAALQQTGDTLWCDLLITRLNQRLPLDTDTTTTLARAYLNRSGMLIRSDELTLADADLNAALLLRPDIPEVHLMLGNLRLVQKRFAEALDHFNEAIVLSDGRQPAYFISRALALRGLGQIGLAADDVRRSRGEFVEAQADINPSGSVGPPGAGSP
jgi:tetratricopeptide (TPR) repeat protein